MRVGLVLERVALFDFQGSLACASGLYWNDSAYLIFNCFVLASCHTFHGEHTVIQKLNQCSGGHKIPLFHVELATDLFIQRVKHQATEQLWIEVSTLRWHPQTLLGNVRDIVHTRRHHQRN